MSREERGGRATIRRFEKGPRLRRSKGIEAYQGGGRFQVRVQTFEIKVGVSVSGSA